jgi:cardiolipin synthase
VLQAAFVQDWYHATRRPLLAPAYFPPVAPAPEPCNAATPEHGKRTARIVAESPPTCSTLQIVTSGPDSRFAAIRQMYFYMITSASDHVYIQSPFFVIDAGLSDALKATALSGVDVKIMVAPKGSNDNPIAYWAGFTYILDVVAAGVEVYLYQPGYLHAKTVSVDGMVCSVGSANMDIRSFQIDYEINAIVYDKAVAQLVEQDFLEDLKDCVRFDPEAYQQLPFVLRLRDAASRMLSPIL